MNNEDKLIYDIVDEIDIIDIIDEIDEVDIDDSVFLTNDMLEKIKRKTYENIYSPLLKIRKRRRLYELAAACVAVIIIITGFIGYDKVLAQIQRMITYVPGIGVYLENHDISMVYFLDNPIKRNYNGKFITVTRIIIEKGNSLITMEGNITINPPKSINIADKSKNSYEVYLDNYITSTNGKYWIARYFDYGYYPRAYADKDFSKLLIKIKEANIDIPIALQRLDNSSRGTQIGVSASKSGVNLIATAYKDNGIIKISYITRKIGKTILSGNYYSLFPIHAIHPVLKDKSNRVYKELNMGDSFIKETNMLYFDGKNTDSKEFKLSIPYLLKYNPSDNPTKCKLLIPENGDLNVNKTVYLDNYPVEFKSVKRVNEDYIALTIDTHTDTNKMGAISNFAVLNHDINIFKQKLEIIPKSNLSIDEVKGELGKYSNKPYFYLYQANSIYKSTGVFKTALIPIDKKAKFVNLDLFSPSIILKGPWEFEIRLK
jgi:hypothetical protein